MFVPGNLDVRYGQAHVERDITDLYFLTGIWQTLFVFFEMLKMFFTMRETEISYILLNWSVVEAKKSFVALIKML